MNLIEISQQLLKLSKCAECVTPHLNQVSELTLSELSKKLDTDDKRKAFWINIYNAYATIYLKPNPDVILKPISRKLFFNKKIIHFKNCSFTLNEIEHDILRKSKIWWGKGYLSKALIKSCFYQLRVQKFDARIHFALNCGGLGCPPIRFYEAENLNNQLEIATEAFLFSEVKIDFPKNRIKISKLFNWYIGDFGGKSGLINFFQKYQVLSPENNNPPSIEYFEYNWEPWIK